MATPPPSDWPTSVASPTPRERELGRGRPVLEDAATRGAGHPVRDGGDVRLAHLGRLLEHRPPRPEREGHDGRVLEVLRAVVARAQRPLGGCAGRLGEPR
jgi:hypothetical protein